MSKEKLNEMIKNIYSNNNDSSKQTECKIKQGALLWAPLKMLFINSKMFLILAVPFALIMTILSFSFHNNVICGIDILNQQNVVKCSQPIELSFLLFQILRLIIIIFFIKSWYKYTISQQKIDLLKTFIPSWQDAKAFFILIFFIFINFIPVISYYVLLKREPNPDWLIESFYFAFVSLGFVLPFLAILYHVVFAYIIAQEKCPPFKQMSVAIFTNARKIMISALFTITFGLLVIIYYIASIMPYITTISITQATIFEMFYNITILIFAALLTNYIFNLRNKLFISEEVSN